MGAVEPVIPEYNRLFVDQEGFASGEFVYVPSIVPGLLQTSEYAAALTRVGQRPPLHRDRIVEFRETRQDRLRDAHEPLELAVVIDEHALGREVGGRDRLRVQLDELLRLAALDTVKVQVMPHSVPVHDGIAGMITLLDFADAQSIGKVEYPDGVVYVGDDHQVAGYHYRREQLRADALDVDASREVIAAGRAAMD